MADKGTTKKITRVEGGVPSSETSARETKPPVEINKGKAKSRRIFAILSWIVAIAFEIAAIATSPKRARNTGGAHCPDRIGFDFWPS